MGYIATYLIVICLIVLIVTVYKFILPPSLQEAVMRRIEGRA